MTTGKYTHCRYGKAIVPVLDEVLGRCTVNIHQTVDPVLHFFVENLSKFLESIIHIRRNLMQEEGNKLELTHLRSDSYVDSVFCALVTRRNKIDDLLLVKRFLTNWRNLIGHISRDVLTNLPDLICQ